LPIPSKSFAENNKILYPLLRLIWPACNIQEIARAMINTTILGYENPILEVSDITGLAAKSP